MNLTTFNSLMFNFAYIMYICASCTYLMIFNYLLFFSDLPIIILHNVQKQYTEYHILLLNNNDMMADVQAAVINSVETLNYNASLYTSILMDIRRFLFLYVFPSFLLYVTVLFFNGEPSGLPGPLCTAF